MVEQMIARRVLAVQQALHPFFDTVLHAPSGGGRSVTADFMTGDPHELPPQGFVEALRRYSVPTSRDWFAYCFAHEPARQAAAASLTAEFRVGFAADDSSSPAALAEPSHERCIPWSIPVMRSSF